MAKRRPSGDGMVRKREDGRWEGRVVIGYKDDGAPIFRYVSAGTQKELLKKLHENIEAYRDVDLREGNKMPLGAWLDRWLEEYAAPSVRPSTLEGYRRSIERNIILPPSTANLLSARKRNAYSEWIFPDPLRPERPTRPNAAYIRMKELLKKAGLPSIRFHE